MFEKSLNLRYIGNLKIGNGGYIRDARKQNYFSDFGIPV